MIEWTIGSLIIVSAILLIVSVIRTQYTSKAAEERIDLAHISLLEELKKLKQSIQNLELDYEIIINEAGVQLSNEEKQLKRDVLDLYRRGYSIENIAETKEVSMQEIENFLAPFINEGRNVAND